ncbi:MAG: TonB-dependent receptor [Candidatus Cloacimonetes bacterium]|nr:TonB-dependent receptor [Candidatus Cloacimonadota bacterium]
MKKLFILFMLLWSLKLIATDFQLPDETIVGTISMTPDSSVVHKSLKDYHRFKQYELIKYNPYLPQKDDMRYGGANLKNGIIRLFFGNYTKSDLYVIYDDYYNDYINLNAESHFLLLNKHWNFTDSRIGWKIPELGNAKLKPELTIHHNTFNSRKIDTNASHIGLETAFDLSEWVYFFQNTSLEIDYTNIKQEFNENNKIVNKIDNYDYLFKSEFNLPFTNINNSLSIGNLNEVFTFESNTNLANIVPEIDNTKLYMSLNKNFVMSLYLEKYMLFDNDYSVMIKNEPYTSFTDSYKQYTNNYHTSIKDMKYQTQSPINLSIAMNSSFYLPYTLLYQFEWRKNQAIYTLGDFDYVYDVKHKNSLLNTIKAYTYYQLYDLNFEYCFTAISSHIHDHEYKQIPFMPHIVNSLNIKYRYANFDAKTELKYVSERKDHTNNQISDAFLIDSILKYEWHHRFNLYLYVENLLNKPYKYYSYYPQQGIICQIGLDYRF